MAQSSPQRVISSAENWLEAYLQVSPDGCPRFRMPSGLLSLNGEVASGYLKFGYRPIALVPDRYCQFSAAMADSIFWLSVRMAGD